MQSRFEVPRLGPWPQVAPSSFPCAKRPLFHFRLKQRKPLKAYLGTLAELKDHRQTSLAVGVNPCRRSPCSYLDRLLALVRPLMWIWHHSWNDSQASGRWPARGVPPSEPRKKSLSLRCAFLTSHGSRTILGFARYIGKRRFIRRPVKMLYKWPNILPLYPECTF